MNIDPEQVINIIFNDLKATGTNAAPR